MTHNGELILLLVIVICTINYLDGRKALSTLLFRKVDTNFEPKYVADFNADIDLNQESINMTVNIIKNLTVDVWMQVTVAQKEPKFNSYKTVFGFNVNICQVIGRGQSLNLVSHWLRNVYKYSNLPMKCPIKQGHYHWINFKPEKDVIPGFIKTASYRIISLIYMREWHNDMITNTSLYVDVKMK